MLSKGLEHLPKIEKIILRDNRITQKSGSEIVMSLHKGVKIIDFSSNRIGTQTIVALTKLINTKHFL
jgi:Ran GTPase-activating protein (RanGAP) involved in mRNA processing and transport